jgi:hypothetical protein
MRVIYTTVATDILDELIPVLYERGYFSYKEDAKKYVDDLYDDIEKNLPNRLKKRAPKFFSDRYGKGLWYAIFPKNKHTSWYVFFRLYKENGEKVYQVRYIDTNYGVTQFF